MRRLAGGGADSGVMTSLLAKPVSKVRIQHFAKRIGARAAEFQTHFKTVLANQSEASNDFSESIREK